MNGMKRLLTGLVLAAVLAACNTSSVSYVLDHLTYYHDDAHAVSCWLYGVPDDYGKAIDCLPDAQVRR